MQATSMVIDTPLLQGRGIYINYLEFLYVGNLSLLSHLLIYAVNIYISMDSRVFYNLSYNTMQLYFMAQNVPTLAKRSSFNTPGSL